MTEESEHEEDGVKGEPLHNWMIISFVPSQKVSLIMQIGSPIAHETCT